MEQVGSGVDQVGSGVEGVGSGVERVGIGVELVAMDLGETFCASQAYVMLSRIEDINQLVIMDCIKEKSIRINPAALIEMEKMNACSIKNNPTIWSRKEGISTKIAVLNVMNLRNNFKYAAQDSTLLLADLICFSETCMTTVADERTCTLHS